MTMTISPNQLDLAKRLRACRAAARLTQAQVAGHLSVSRPTVAQIESGNRAVSSLELDRLAYLFGRDIRELLAPSFEEDSALSALFRASPEVASDEQLAQSFRASLRLARELTRLEERLGISRPEPPVFSPTGAAPRTRWDAIVQGDRAAEEERQRLGLGSSPIEDVAEVLESQGVRTAWISLPQDVSGLTLRGREIGVYVVANSEHAWLRRRFSCAHEYAHVLLDRDQLGLVSRARDREVFREVRANAFAASFLMPAAGVRVFMESLGKGARERGRADLFDEVSHTAVNEVREPGRHSVQIYDVVLLAHHFGVSRLAALYRLKNLGLLSQGELDELKRQEERSSGKAIAEAMEICEPDAMEMRSEFRRRSLGLALEALRRELISVRKMKELGRLLGFSERQLDVMLVEAGLAHPDDQPVEPLVPEG
jgi:Zn-dependent peptidase ImmA (M78 family)/DNA-binding XRE family transcriptional regulator